MPIIQGGRDDTEDEEDEGVCLTPSHTYGVSWLGHRGLCVPQVGDMEDERGRGDGHVGVPLRGGDG